MYETEVEDRLARILQDLFKGNRATYERCIAKIAEISGNPQHYKPLRHDLKGLRRVHIGHFVLVFRIIEADKKVRFLDFDHHDRIYKKRFMW